MSPNRKVYLLKEGIFANLIAENLYAARVQYVYGGVLYDTVIESDEYIELDEFDNLEEEWEE